VRSGARTRVVQWAKVRREVVRTGRRQEEEQDRLHITNSDTAATVREHLRRDGYGDASNARDIHSRPKEELIKEQMTSLVLPGSLSLSTRPKNPNSQVSGSRAGKRVLNWFAAAEGGNFQDPFQLKKRDKYYDG